jgi:P pilus assembly chaperone PapD
MALPPIQRIEAGSASQVRIVKQAATSQLPKDRESLFYFNLREVPRKAPAPAMNAASCRWRCRAGSSCSGALKRLQKTRRSAEMRMEISATAKGLTIHNPTPYYITLAWLSKNAKTMLPGFDSLMLAPFATATTSTGDYHGNYYSIGYIDDYGALKKSTYSARERRSAALPNGRSKKMRKLANVLFIVLLSAAAFRGAGARLLSGRFGRPRRRDKRSRRLLSPAMHRW